MKILFVSMIPFEYNTSATIQNKGIIKGLVELGHEVDTLTLMPNKDAISYDDSINDIKGLINNSYYIDINPIYAILMARKQESQGAKTGKSKGGMVKYILKKVRPIIKKIYDNVSIFDAQKYNVKGVSKLKIDYSKYDIIISASDPKSSHLIVERIFKENKNCRAKWIQYWGDPMLIDITRKNDWRDIFVRYAENKLIAKADKVVYASPLTLKKQKEIFPKHAVKMDYVNQACVDNVLDSTEKTAMKKREDSAITVGYFGEYRSTIRNIIPLYNVAINSDFKLNICGSSDLVLKETSNVSVYGFVPYNQVLEKEKEADILVCICNSKGTQIPGKIYYYLAYKKPIVVILDGEYKNELRDYLEQFNRFILCDNEEKSIKEAIERAKSELGKKEYHIPEQVTPKYIARKIINGLA